jgi:cell division initiation protein
VRRSLSAVSLTPVEIRHVTLPRRLLGYERSGVDRLLSDIATSFEDVWRERADLRDEIERLESELRRQREIEEALRNTLLSAERMADELRARAHREADLIVEEARAKAREVASAAEAEQERTRDEIRRLRALEIDVRAEFRAFLASALDRLEGESVAPRAQAGRDRHQAA